MGEATVKFIGSVPTIQSRASRYGFSTVDSNLSIPTLFTMTARTEDGATVGGNAVVDNDVAESGIATLPPVE